MKSQKYGRLSWTVERQQKLTCRYKGENSNQGLFLDEGGEEIFCGRISLTWK